ncbi:MAG TPA: hypothetical protein PLL24_09885, partial [Thiobacillaceae bacterium]|nr:hypothetical protein [Thiobacillaceae bacterium]
ADAPWTPSRFETRERVVSRLNLAVGGEIRVPLGAVGEVLKVVREGDTVRYHVHFSGGQVLQVPENALDTAPADARMEARVTHREEDDRD